MKPLIYLLTVILFATGCSKDSCITGSGAILTEIRSLAPFTQIDLYSRINLILTYDIEQQIRVEAGKNLLHGIVTSVAGNTLTISDNNGCNWVRNLDNRINVYVTSNALERINYYGAGNIIGTNTLRYNSLTIDSWEGVGSVNVQVESNQCVVFVRKNNTDVTVSGNSTNVHIYCADQGKVDMRNCTSSNLFIDHRSIYDAFINVSTSLTARVLYKGNIYYKGEPFKDVVYANSGKLLPLQ